MKQIAVMSMRSICLYYVMCANDRVELSNPSFVTKLPVLYSIEGRIIMQNVFEIRMF